MRNVSSTAGGTTGTSCISGEACFLKLRVTSLARHVKALSRGMPRLLGCIFAFYVRRPWHRVQLRSNVTLNLTLVGKNDSRHLSLELDTGNNLLELPRLDTSPQDNDPAILLDSNGNERPVPVH